MRRTLPLAVLVALAAVALPDPAESTVPSPLNSTIPAYIRIGGFQAAGPGGSAGTAVIGAPDPTIAYTVQIRDALNVPVANALVVVDFNSCTDTWLCTTVIGGQVTLCPPPNKQVVGSTDIAGMLTLYVTGGSDNPGGIYVPPAIFPGAGAGCAKVYADGILMGNATSVIYNPNGAVGGGGVNGGDMSIVKSDVGAIGLGAPYKGRSDFDGSGAVNGADISALKTVIGCSGLGGCSFSGCPDPYCN